MQNKKNQLWQIELFKYSFMKKEKVNLIKKHLKKITKNTRVIDIGCRQGIVSYFIKKIGGIWLHCDLEKQVLDKAKPILKQNLVQIDENLPVKSKSVNTVFCLDFLEHIDDDNKVIKEIKRIQKNKGKLIISTPITGKFFLVNKIKKIFGMKPEIYGHKREGYRLKDLEEKLQKQNFKIIKSTTYSKFFTELIETTLNIIFVHLVKRKKKSSSRTGSISPESQKDFKGNKKIYILYKIVYPLLKLITLFDKLLFFKTGYATFIIAEKNEKSLYY